MEWIDLLQWPAMAVTIAAAWMIASQKPQRRRIGFLLFLAGNVLWIAWGWHDRAIALMVLQLFLAFENVRGIRKNEQPETADS